MNMENDKLKELHKKIGECIYNIESGTFEHWKATYKPNSLREGQVTEGAKLVASSRKQIHALINEFYIKHKEELYLEKWIIDSANIKKFENEYLQNPKIV